jgi:hypothetical protein
MARVPAEVNRLSNQVLVHTYEAEWGGALNDGRALTGALAAAAGGWPLACLLPRCQAPPPWPSRAGSPASARARPPLREPPAGRVPRRRPAPVPAPRAAVLIAGAGVAGLAAARALRQRGASTTCGCWSWKTAPAATAAGSVGGMACPLGAHYLPLPGDPRTRCRTCWKSWACAALAGRWRGRRAPPVPQPAGAPVLRRRLAGRPAAAVPGVGAPRWRSTALCRRRWWRRRSAARAASPCRPCAPLRSAAHLRAGRQTFAAWLARRAWTTRTCAGTWTTAAATTTARAGRVSAWAGCTTSPAATASTRRATTAGEREAVLTWPEGNAWLVQRWPRRWRCAGRRAAADGALAGGQPAAGHSRCWTARRAAGLGQRGLRPAALGYVDAMHQSLRPYAAPHGADGLPRAAGLAPSARQLLLAEPDAGPAWAAARAAGPQPAPTPTSTERLQQVDLMRWGHAMAVPVPGRAAPPGAAMALRGGAAACALRTPTWPATRCSKRPSPAGIEA